MALPAGRRARGALALIVGVCRLELVLAENHSLKGKRQVLRSVITRLRNRFNLAVAEVDEQENWRTAILGFSCVSNAAPHAREMLEKAVQYVETMRLDAEVMEHQIEMIYPFDG